MEEGFREGISYASLRFSRSSCGPPSAIRSQSFI